MTDDELFDDELFMGRALRLAACARHASPNPAVGCVLVGPDGTRVGEGWTQPPGQAHAEVMALRAAGVRARAATAYVTLEPCSHHGRTPPCADALLLAGVTRVVAALADPDARVAGRGLARLQAGGVAVTLGVGEARARALNAPFLKHRTTGLPWVVLKTAMTLDGKIAAYTGDSRWITSPVSRLAVHRQLRDRCDAILTGVGTILADDPVLTTRLVHRGGRDPWRVIVDSRCRTPLDAQVVRRTAQDGKTLIATTEAAELARRDALSAQGCQVLLCASTPIGRVDLRDLMLRLGTRGDMIGVLGECGGALAAGLLDVGLVDRWLSYIAPKIIGGDTSPGPIGGLGRSKMADALTIRAWQMRRSGPDLVIDARIG